jgi:hypothetical protein
LKRDASRAGDFSAQEAQLAPVQRKGGDAEKDVHAAAARGTSGSAGALPHADRIQKSFGDHDISHIKAHTDGAAAEGSAAMGAEAYATGDHVAFKGAPDLHTAAHEAAHVVQQQAGVQLSGGVGKAGDSYEQNADAVADAVVAGKDASGLLGKSKGGGGGGVQRKAVQQRQNKKTLEQLNTTKEDVDAKYVEYRKKAPTRTAALKSLDESMGFNLPESYVPPMTKEDEVEAKHYAPGFNLDGKKPESKPRTAAGTPVQGGNEVGGQSQASDTPAYQGVGSDFKVDREILPKDMKLEAPLLGAVGAGVWISAKPSVKLSASAAARIGKGTSAKLALQASVAFELIGGAKWEKTIADTKFKVAALIKAGLTVSLETSAVTVARDSEGRYSVAAFEVDLKGKLSVGGELSAEAGDWKVGASPLGYELSGSFLKYVTQGWSEREGFKGGKLAPGPALDGFVSYINRLVEQKCEPYHKRTEGQEGGSGAPPAFVEDGEGGGGAGGAGGRG